MSRAVGADRNTDTTPVCHRDRTKTLLACAFELHMLGGGEQPDQAGDGPWDMWWTCYRTQRSAGVLGLGPRQARGCCEVCAVDASRLAFATPPEHPDDAIGQRRCSCLLEWATSMRQPAPGLAWPIWRLTVGMVKPGSDPAAVRGLLGETHTVLEEIGRSLTPVDVRRLYPDAYGTDYVTRHDDYLISSPVTVFVLLAHPTAVGQAKEIKVDIRRRLGDGDVPRNHLHMPDSPGDAFADLDHLAGTEMFTGLYERYERDRADDRVARYRALLEHPDSRHRAG